jgi:hypothetical protein
MLPLIDFGNQPTGIIVPGQTSLNPYITFTRASNATDFNSAGVLTTEGNNVARFDFNPALARTNFIRNGNATGAVVGNPGTLATNTSFATARGLSTEVISTSSVNGVAGQTIRVFGVPSSSGACDFTLETSAVLPALNNQTWALSSYLQLVSGNFTNVTLVSLKANAFDNAVNYLNTFINTVVAVGGTFTRFSATGTTSFAATDRIQPIFGFNVTSGLPVDFTIFIGSSQLERAAAATDYIPTSGTAVTIAPPRGLLVEGARTNELLRSQELENAAWAKFQGNTTANTSTSPDGTTNADNFVPTAIAGDHTLNQLLASTDLSIVRTFSIFVKANPITQYTITMRNNAQTIGIQANIDLSVPSITANNFGSPTSSTTPTITNVGNGWFRVTIGGALAASTETIRVGLIRNYTPNGTDGLLVWGAQLEQASFPSSYIPTTGAAATRAQDVSGILNLASIGFNPLEGTFIIETVANGITGLGAERLFTLSDGTENNRIDVANISGNWRPTVVSGGVAVAALTLSPIVAGSVAKVAIAYKLDDYAACMNGGTVQTDALGALPVGLSQLYFASSASGATTGYNGWYQRATYYPTRLSNAQLQSLSA